MKRFSFKDMHRLHKLMLFLAFSLLISCATGCEFSDEDKEFIGSIAADVAEDYIDRKLHPEEYASVSSYSHEDYDGRAWVEVNDNEPYFTEEDLGLDCFEVYSDLDGLGRPGTAYACICVDTVPKDGEKRGEIGHVRPAGWHTVKYNDRIEGNYLYNRCHLIGWQLGAENDNELNLITGTRYLNISGMLEHENAIAQYVRENPENHVLYRVTPMYDGGNLLCEGLLLEARSVEDDGVRFCVFAYNVQPGVIIDYATGESEEDPEWIGDR